MKGFKRILSLSVPASIICFGFTSFIAAQDRPRIVTTGSSRPVVQQPSTTDKTQSLSSSTPQTTPTRPTLTNKLIVVAEPPKSQPLVKKTAATAPVAGFAAGRTAYGLTVSGMIMRGIQSRWGIPYLYGSSGPNRYDCSGFVWSVFRDAGIDFERVSARTLWSESTPVTGDERFKFGTLVFLNGLGHMGIVADENGFYHASSSKGVTYSPFKGYWENRIVGFRRLNPVQKTEDKTQLPDLDEDR